LKAIEATLENTLLYALALTALFGVIGGAWISRVVLSRLDQINQTSQEIMSGDLSRRIPILGSNDELDELATNLNAMLGQIEGLMTGMREVADNIAHDLRTPLNRLRNRLEGAMMANETPEDTKASLESAIEEADGLIATFNSLLLIAEAESGAHRDALEDVDLRAIARDVVDLYEPVAEERGIALTLTAPDPARVRGNPSLVARAAANLVDNALKYTPQGGKVLVVVDAGLARADGPELTVRDSGPGIPAQDRERVLDRFVRLERSRNTPGSGLGLSLVAAVARMHGASLELGDAGPGLVARLVFPKPLHLAHAAQ
jgi:signal transduction histidine kinase